MKTIKKITIYKDAEDQKRQEIENILKTPPAERIAQVVTLIKRLYTIKSTSGNKIIIYR